MVAVRTMHDKGDSAMRVTRTRRAGALIGALAAGGLLVSAAAACTATSAAGRAGATGGPATSAPPGPAPFGPGSTLYGVNYDYAGTADFALANAGPLLKRLDPETLRWPDGTEADYFDWRTGMPTKNPGGYKFTLTDLYRAYQATGAPPIFDLNVLTPANRLNTSDQVEMLTAAHDLGLPIKYVEIGNELYGGGAFRRAFPSGAVYGTTVAAYVKVLHRDFPGVQVAADAVLNPVTVRQQQWNAQLLATAAGTGAPDALILHDYPGVTYKPFTTADLPPLFGSAYTAISDLTSAVRSLDGKPVWLTEYNFRGPYVPRDRRKPDPVVTSYAHELYLAEFALMLPRVPRLAMADNWVALAGGPEFGAWTTPASPTLTPGGQAVEMIDAAARGAQSSVPITIQSIPTLPGGGPAVAGQAFSAPGRATTALLVNLTGSPQKVPISADIPIGAQYQQAVGQPTAQRTAAAPLISGVVTGTYLRLPAYSVTLVNATTGAQ